MAKICPESGQEPWLVDMVVILFYLLFTNDRQKTTRVKCKWGLKHDESTTNQSIFLEYNYSLEKASEFCSRTQNFTIIDQEKHKIKQIYIWNPTTTGFIL